MFSDKYARYPTLSLQFSLHYILVYLMVIYPS